MMILFDPFCIGKLSLRTWIIMTVAMCSEVKNGGGRGGAHGRSNRSGICVVDGLR